MKSILLLIAFFALMLPCAHAAGHHHDEQVADALSAPACDDCHTCTEEPCSKPKQVVSISVSSVLAIPIRRIELLTVLKTDYPVPVDNPYPSIDLQCLQTIRLLI